ncbi:MAG: hypothetical protein KJ990_11950 [Proteobacteria bacterium]|nr:hypothetical protein [Pseudomonadota bacterium]MBU1649843.1 hypothetical protein [Pseudomonadota bacterium]MBU1986023.1 hypothetical protein [Pseudomonadota bacterium]
MRTNTLTSKETKIDTGYETSKFALATGITMAALVGIWGCACMISGLVSGGLVKGFITAITGL